MVYLNVLGHKVIILNSAEDATELLEKRAALYSDRTQIPMVVDPALYVKATTIRYMSH
jgi:hypothetical protein